MESMIAEKFQAMVKPGILNSRMKDFYDIWVLSSMFNFKTEVFRNFIQHICKIMDRLDFENKNLKYINTALGMLTKAFFADGLDQLLWHITSIDALFGERGEDITEKLGRRIAAIMGKTKKEKKDLKSRFKALYNFRSALVHGNKFGKEIYWSHLREARDFARKSLVWFLNFLAAIHHDGSIYKDGFEYPNRKVILTLLDMDEKERTQLKSTLKTLPLDFPYKGRWLL